MEIALRDVVTAHGLNTAKLIVASLRELFRSDRQPSADIDHSAEEYCGHLFLIEELTKPGGVIFGLPYCAHV